MMPVCIDKFLQFNKDWNIFITSENVHLLHTLAINLKINNAQLQIIMAH